MRTRTLGRTGLTVSEIGIGTWQFGGGLESGVGHGWGGIDDDESIRVVHAAEDLGINFIDSADIYGNGHSEEVVGRALQGRRDKWIVATKVGLVKKPDEEGQYEDASPQHVREGLEASLRRLQTDFIDVYQLHCMPTAVQLPDTMATLEDLRTAGKIRFYGISHDRAEFIRQCEHHGRVWHVQLAYSMLNAGAHELLTYCGRQAIGVIIRSPFGLGLLTGKHFRGRLEFPANDQRRRWWDNERTRFLSYALAALGELAAERGCTMPQFALRYVLDRNEVSVVIPGTKSVAQLIESAAAADLVPLSPWMHGRVNGVVRAAFAAAPAHT